MVNPATILTVAQAVSDDPGVNVDISTGLGGGALGAFVTTLVVGALLIALAPTFTDRVSDALEGEPVNSFLYGIMFLIAIALMIVLLVITIIGILVAIPLFLVAYIVWAIGSAIAFLTIGQRLVDDEDWKLPLLVGALLNGGLTLTGVGAIISLVIGAAGFGAVLRDYFE
jgi:hypothetical protein